MITKFLFKPVNPFQITQNFGEDKCCVDKATFTKYIYKETSQTCPVGFKSVYSMMKGHNGLDLVAKRWQPCYAMQDGEVVEVSTEEARGLGVTILTNDKYYCEESKTTTQFVYKCWHFIANNVHVGDKVEVGSLLGYCDSTGYSTGDHLHIELKPVTVSFKKGKRQITNILQDNGYFGAVNPITYMENTFALDFAGFVKKFRELSARITDWMGDKLRGQ